MARRPARTNDRSREDAREKLLGAGIELIRERGFTATTVDHLCERAGVTKGAFFHHFASKEAFGVAVAEHWTAVTGALFERAPYHRPASAAERLLAYVAFRTALVSGGLANFTCLAGTMLQEVYQSAPAVGEACGRSILGHAQTLEADCAAALEAAGRRSPSASSLARHIQAVIQGAFILAKASGDADAARDAILHLELYLRLLLRPDREARPVRSRR